MTEEQDCRSLNVLQTRAVICIQCKGGLFGYSKVCTYIYMVVCCTTSILTLTQRYNCTRMENYYQYFGRELANIGDILNGDEPRRHMDNYENYYQYLGRELANIGDILNENEQRRHVDNYEMTIRLSSFASFGLGAGLALFVTYQFLRRKYARNE